MWIIETQKSQVSCPIYRVATWSRPSNLSTEFCRYNHTIPFIVAWYRQEVWFGERPGSHSHFTIHVGNVFERDWSLPVESRSDMIWCAPSTIRSLFFLRTDCWGQERRKQDHSVVLPLYRWGMKRTLNRTINHNGEKWRDSANTLDIELIRPPGKADEEG